MKSIKNLWISLVLGLLIGLLATGFFKVLASIQIFHQQNSYYIYFLPLIWILLKFIRHQTLFFPLNVAQTYQSDEVSAKHWSKWGLPFNFIGASLSHFAGASVGREGAVVVFATELAQIFKLSLQYFKPIAMSAGFAIAMDNPWIALVFIFEMFSTRIDQKIFSVIAAWIGCLILKTFQVPPLIPTIEVSGQISFWDLLVFVFVLAASVGYLSRVYKWIHRRVKILSQPQKKYWAFLCVIILTSVMCWPDFKSMHSLSLEALTQATQGHVTAQFFFIKFLLTVVCVSIGFWGGDFVPSLVLGNVWGVFIAQKLKIPDIFGLMFGCYSFFLGFNLLKWTAYFLTIAVFGTQHFMMLYFYMSLVQSFAGPVSLYKTE